MNVTQFTRSLKAIVRKHLRCDFTLVFVCGNSSADLDSITSSINFSYLEYKKSGKWVFPLINIPRADLNLRRDVCWLLEKSLIDADDLLFVEDLKAIETPVEFILVDHNVPQGYVKEYISANGSKIYGIIDHHVDEGKYPDANPRIVESCGSCSSLVNIYYKDTIAKTTFDAPELMLLTSGVCADTSGLKFRVEPKDVESMALFGLDSLGLVELTKNLHEAKDNIEGLSMMELLKKDYKEFDTKRGKLGISSITATFDYCKTQFQEKGVTDAIAERIKERGIFELVVMATHTNNKGEFCRDIGFSHMASTEGLEELKLTPFDDFNGFKMYHQGNLGASRKKVAPLLVSLYNQ